MDDDDEAPRPPPAHWVEAIEEGDAELARGLTVPLKPLLDEMRRAAEELETRLVGRPESRPAPASSEP